MVRKNKALAALAAAGALALTACGTGLPDGVTKLYSATMVQPNVPNAPVENWFLDEIEKRSKGRIIIDRSEPESFCHGGEIAECVRDRRVDIGTSIADYTPQLFPTLTIVTVPFMANNQQALMQSLYKINTTNEDAIAKWDSIGLKYVAAWGPGKLILGSKDRIIDMKDIDGVRFRVTGGFLQRAFQGAGANVIALTAGETYEGVERGIADAVAWTMDGPVDYKMIEQLGTWTDPGIGQYTSFAIWMNQDAYDSLDEDLQQMIDEVIEELNMGAGMEAFNAATEPQCDALLAHGNLDSFTKWDESVSNEWRDAVQGPLLEEWKASAEQNGLRNADQYLEQYQALLEEASNSPDLVEDPVEACIARFEAGE